MNERFIDTKRGRVFYWTNEAAQQKDPCIVFCHGLTADHCLFDMQADNITSYKMITWDLPLHGKSRPYDSFSFENSCEDLVTILDKEKIENIILVGQSAGGYISQYFIKRYPDKVKGFVGIGTTPFGAGYYRKSELFWIKNYTAIARLIPYSLYCRMGADSITYSEKARQSIYDTLVSLGRKGMLKAVSAVYGEFLKQPEPVDFKCPVLLTHGEYENTGLVKKYNKLWASELGLDIKVIEKASHNANYDNHEAFNRLLLDFISEIG